MHTRVKDDRSQRTIAGFVLGMWPYLKWRHNGLGLLQAYVLEGAVDELRVHVWHKSLQREGIEDSGLIHDHRFDLTSHVLVGEIEQREYSVFSALDGAWSMHTVEHAREALAKQARAKCTFSRAYAFTPRTLNAISS